MENKMKVAIPFFINRVLCSLMEPGTEALELSGQPQF
jgi:hypothetical protein